MVTILCWLNDACLFLHHPWTLLENSAGELLHVLQEHAISIPQVFCICVLLTWTVSVKPSLCLINLKGRIAKWGSAKTCSFSDSHARVHSDARQPAGEWHRTVVSHPSQSMAMDGQATFTGVRLTWAVHLRAHLGGPDLHRVPRHQI